MEEMIALNENKTWKIVPLSDGKKAMGEKGVGCKWVFTTKLNANENIDI